MRIAYAGTASFGALVLDRLLAQSGHEVVLVISRPDRPRGRRGTPQPSPVKETALAAGLPIHQPERLQGEACGPLLEPGPEAFVVCAFGEIICGEVLERLPTLVVHPSLLPRWRGPAPVERALMAGETELGVAVLRMAEEVDAGPVAERRTVHVPRDADAGEAFELLAGPACDATVDTLSALGRDTVVWRAQEDESTYAPKLQKSDRDIDWDRPAAEIVDQVRALSPAIGAQTTLAGRPLTIWKARVRDERPDDVGRERVVLPAGDGFVEILEVQAPGGRRQPIDCFLRGAGRWLLEE